jgi:integrase
VNQAPLIKVSFRPAKTALEPNFYQQGENTWWFRYTAKNGSRNWKKLRASRLDIARKEFRKLSTELDLWKAGMGPNPFGASETLTIRQLAEQYLAAGCPKRRAGHRTAQTLAEEKKRVATLLQWWNKKTPGEIAAAGPELQRRYHTWRTAPARLKRHSRGGDRQVDKEIITLSNILHHATQNPLRTGLTQNPLKTKITFRDPAQITHCREHMPANPDELHAIARYLFTSRKSEILGWLTLLQSMIGHRISELLKLRRDAKTEHDPGYRFEDTLHLYKSRTTKKTDPYREIKNELRAVLEAFDLWHYKRYGRDRTPWFFPSPEDPSKPLTASALTHALARICPAMGIPKRTSHGLRAYYANVRRSQGESDTKIAEEMGHHSGIILMQQVYGDRLKYKLTWRPKETPPAWTWFEPVPPKQTQLELGI